MGWGGSLVRGSNLTVSNRYPLGVKAMVDVKDVLDVPTKGGPRTS